MSGAEPPSDGAVIPWLRVGGPLPYALKRVHLPDGGVVWCDRTELLFELGCLGEGALAAIAFGSVASVVHMFTTGSLFWIGPMGLVLLGLAIVAGGLWRMRRELGGTRGVIVRSEGPNILILEQSRSGDWAERACAHVGQCRLELGDFRRRIPRLGISLRRRVAVLRVETDEFALAIEKSDEAIELAISRLPTEIRSLPMFDACTRWG